MTIWDNIKFGDLGTILEELYKMHCEVLLGGNEQPPYDEEHWMKAEASWWKIKKIIEK